MIRISGGAVWSNRPRSDLARASAEQLAEGTLPRDRIRSGSVPPYSCRTHPAVAPGVVRCYCLPNRKDPYANCPAFTAAVADLIDVIRTAVGCGVGDDEKEVL